MNEVIKTLEYMADNGYGLEFEDGFKINPKDIYRFLREYHDIKHEVKTQRAGIKNDNISPVTKVYKCLRYMSEVGGVWETILDDDYPWEMRLEYSPTKRFGDAESNLRFNQKDLQDFMKKLQVFIDHFNADMWMDTGIWSKHVK